MWRRTSPGNIPDTNKLQTIGADILQNQVIGTLRTAGLLVLGAVGFVLLIACANVAIASRTRQ